MDQDADVYERLRLDLTRLAAAIVGPSDAEDVVAQVVLRALRRRSGLAGLRDPKPYLVRAVINEARSRVRAVRRRAEVRSEPILPAETGGEQGHLVELVSTLPPRQRAATFLVYWEGHTATSAGALMGCRPATVRRYLHLARNRLKEMILDED